MRNAISRTLLCLLPAVGLAALAVVWPAAGCANSAKDCAQLGLPDGCGGAASTMSTGGTGGTGTGGTSTGGTGGTGTGGTGTGGTSAGGAGGTGGGTGEPVLAACAHKHWGDDQDQRVLGLALDSQGVVLGGTYHGVLNVGGSQIVAGNSGSLFVGRFDADLLSGTWARTFDAGYLAMTTDAQGDIFLAGPLTGPVDFKCTNALDPSTGGGFYLVKLTASGDCVFARQFDAAMARASLAADPQGGVILAGSAEGAANFVDPPVTTQGKDIVIARFDALGNPLWRRVYGGASDDEATGVAVDGAGNFFVAGTFNGKIDFGDGNGAHDSQGHVGVFAVRFGGTSNGAQWATSFAGDNDVAAAGVVALSTGEVAVGGAFTGSLDVGLSKALSSTGGAFFLARLDGTAGNVKTAPAQIEGLAPADISAMAGSSNGAVAIAGSTASGLYVATVDAQGQVTFHGAASGGADHRATGVAFSAADKLLVGGYFDGTLGTDQAFSSNGGDDALLLRVCLPSP